MTDEQMLETCGRINQRFGWVRSIQPIEVLTLDGARASIIHVVMKGLVDTDEIDAARNVFHQEFDMFGVDRIFFLSDAEASTYIAIRMRWES